MTRVRKIDNALKKRLERAEDKKRVVDTRDQVVYFLIVCEGTKTEPNYFKELENELPKGVMKIDIEGSGMNTLSLVDYTIKLKAKAIRNYDRVWVVFDKDDFPDENFNSAIYKALGNDIQCAWTNEAFELWFLLHFQYVSVAMKREDYKKSIEVQIQNISGDGSYIYLKNSIGTFSLLNKYGNQSQAIKWAKRLLSSHSDGRYATHNPCTLVHILIEELLDPKKVLASLLPRDETF